VKFRKKPVVIEAFQFDGTPAAAIKLCELSQGLRFESPLPAKPGRGKIIIPTLEGEMAANPGDWIIRGVKGELYPCKPDIFEATYEPVG